MKKYKDMLMKDKRLLIKMLGVDGKFILTKKGYKICSLHAKTLGFILSGDEIEKVCSDVYLKNFQNYNKLYEKKGYISPKRESNKILISTIREKFFSWSRRLSNVKQNSSYGKTIAFIEEIKRLEDIMEERKVKGIFRHNYNLMYEITAKRAYRNTIREFNKQQRLKGVAV